MKLTAQDIELIEQLSILRARDSFLSYRKYISNCKLKTNWFVEEITEALQQFYLDYITGKRPKLVIQAPPQHGKSEAVTDAICWMAGQNPNLKFIYASFSERLGVRANLKLQRNVDNIKYQKIFPNTKINTKNTVTNKGYQRNKEFIEFVDCKGSFRNTTVRGSITGESLDIGIIDDPIKGREEANSQTIRDKTWDWFNDDFGTRFDEYAGLIIILTRWHIDDPVGRLLAKDKSVKLLTYKAIAEEDEEYRNEMEALFPEHKSLDFLLARKASMDESSWQSLYQQNPIVKGGNLFKEEWFKYYDVEPKFTYRAIFADTAQKTGDKNDYTVMQCWGYTATECYLIDQIRGKWEAPELLNNARMFWNKHFSNVNGYLRDFNIEDKVSGTGLWQTLKRDGIPVNPIKPLTDKLTRALDAVPSFSNGFVYLPRHASWLIDYKSELQAFPNGVHDDQVDPTVYAITSATKSFDYSLLF